jgi:hypothetical protein
MKEVRKREALGFMNLESRGKRARRGGGTKRLKPASQQ